MRRTGRIILGFLLVVTSAQLFVFHHYDSMLARTVAATSSQTSDKSSGGPDLSQVIANYDKMKETYSYTALSTNGQLASYVDDHNVLHVQDLSTKKELCQTQASYPVDYTEWVANDSVFVGEKEPDGTLVLSRVDAHTGAQQVIHNFSGLLSSDDIVKIAYSTLTNDTYVLIGNSSDTVLYHFDTNGNLDTVNVGGRYLKNIAVTETDDTLYFEDYAKGSFNVGVLPLNGQIRIIERNRALVGSVGDTVYFGTLNSSGLVTSIYTGESQLVKTLSNPVKVSDIMVTEDGQLVM